MEWRRCVLCVTLFIVFGCQIGGNKTIPRELYGVWETSSPRCEDCLFELREGLVIFQTGLSHMSINHIRDIKKTLQNGWTFFTIYYEDGEGLENKIGLLFYPTNEGGVLKFRNQDYIKWTKTKNIYHS